MSDEIIRHPPLEEIISSLQLVSATSQAAADLAMKIAIDHARINGWLGEEATQRAFRLIQDGGRLSAAQMLVPPRCIVDLYETKDGDWDSPSHWSVRITREGGARWESDTALPEAGLAIVSLRAWKGDPP